jgi:hypothetical protein
MEQSSYTKRIVLTRTSIKRTKICYRLSLIDVVGSWNIRHPRFNLHHDPYPYPDPHPYPNLESPYTNVLDLQMFPAMSKRHSELLQLYSNNEANAERIWRAACEV